MNQLKIPKGLTEVQPVREIIFEYLREAIIEGTLTPGQRLVERELAEKFQASRTPVREALRKLEMEGFIERQGRRGDVVRLVDYSEMEEAYLLRFQLEPLMIQEAIRNITESQKEKLQKILDTAQAAQNSGDGQKLSEELASFDEFLMDISNRPKLRMILLSLREDLERFRRYNLSHQQRRSNALKEHRGIFEAIFEGNAESAMERTKTHVLNAFEEIKKELKK